MRLSINEELSLKQIEISDTAPIFKIIDGQRPYLGKWLPFVEFTKDFSDVEAFIKSVVNAPESSFEFVFTIRKIDEIIGLISFKNTDFRDKKTEIGYWLSQEYQGNGIMTLSVTTLCNFAFNTLKLNRIEIKCAIENHSSIAVTKKLGFTYEGIQRHGEYVSKNCFRDLKVYSLLKSDY